MRDSIYQLPQHFLQKLKEIYPFQFEHIANSFARPKVTSFRINYLKTDLVNLRRELLRERAHSQELPYPKGAFLLKIPLREFQKTSIYAKGLVYVQNVSSMLPVTVLNPQNNDKILDLCAAPGTKTTQILSLAPQAKVVAIEKARIRYYKLLANLKVQGIEAVLPGKKFDNCYPSEFGNNDFSKEDDQPDDGSSDSGNYSENEVMAEELPPEDSLNAEQDNDPKGPPKVKVYLIDGIWVRKKFPEYFDKILVDAPCSAEGRFQLDNPRTYKYWSSRKVNEMVHTQKKLISAAFFALNEGAEMVYSTCTFSPEENEGIIDWFINKFNKKVELLPIDIPLSNAYKGFTRWENKKFSQDLLLTRRIIPNDYMEGFFVAKFKKISF